MTMKKKGLGRNLSALLGHPALSGIESTPSPEAQKHLPVQSLQPGKYQPRGEIEEEPLAELAASIKQQGVLQPLLVRPLSTDRYEIIAGERRWRASQLAGLTEVPVVIKEVDDETAMAMALVENLQREDLNAMDQARAMHRLTAEFGMTHQQVAEVLAKSRTAVSNFLRLLTLAEPVKKLVEHGDLDMGHARALLTLDEVQQTQVADIIVAKNLSVREAEKLVARVKDGKPVKPSQSEPAAMPFLNDLSRLSNQLGTRIQVRSSRSGKGTLVIQFPNEHYLQRLLKEMDTLVID